MPSLQTVVRRLRAASDPLAHHSYSLEGEDLILERMLGHRADGFYVDIGAHHPRRFSNTYIFYSRGWRGLNVDAMPGSMEAFRRERPRDICVEAGVAAAAGTLLFHVFNEPLVNTFDATLADEWVASGAYRLVRKVEVQCRPLSRMLEEHVPADTYIDFMSVDVEGMSLVALQSNDWSRFRPGFLVVETDMPSEDPTVPARDDAIMAYLASQGYAERCRTTLCSIFADARQS